MKKREIVQLETILVSKMISVFDFVHFIIDLKTFFPIANQVSS